MRPLGMKMGFDTQEGASVVPMCKLFAGMEDFASLEYIVQPFFLESAARGDGEGFHENRVEETRLEYHVQACWQQYAV